jgi:hypothetical protein
MIKAEKEIKEREKEYPSLWPVRKGQGEGMN